MRFRFDDLPAAQRRQQIFGLCSADEGMPVNCESALRSDDTDVQWLLRKSYIELRRSHPGSRSRITKAFATPAGLAAQANGKLF